MTGCALINWLTQFQTLIVGAVGFLGVIVTMVVNGRQNREQRWWARRADAYESVIGALHDSKMFSEEHLEADYRGRELPEDRDRELRAIARKANEEVYKATATGTFYLSAEALERLKRYHRETGEAAKAQMWFEYLEIDQEATSSCLGDFIQIAKKDLKV